MNDQERKKVRSVARLRALSKRLYGNADRLQVAFAVARSSGLVHAQELSDELHISPPRVRAQLLAFVGADLMCILPRTGQTQNYERLDDPFWEAIPVLLEAWMADPARSLGLYETHKTSRTAPSKSS